MKGCPLFSIVIPSYNYAHLLPRAVNSVISQKGDDWELLVINDGSQDNTSEVVAALMADNPEKILYIEKENAGAAAARNTGINAAKGRYLIFLDADDEMIDGAMQVFREALLDNPNAALLIGGYDSVFESGRVKTQIPTKLPVGRLGRVKAYLIDKTLSILNGPTAMRRDVFSRYLYRESFRSVEDLPMFAYILANYEVALVAHNLVRIHKHDDSLRHNTVHAKQIGLALVDEVFDRERMPEEIQSIRKQYASQRALSLFRTFYNAREYGLAKCYYHQAIGLSLSSLFKFSYLRKYIKALFK